VRLKALVWIVRPSQGGPEVLLLQRPARRGAGEHPVTGKADPGESAIDCAAREASEETGLTGDLVELGHAHRYDRRKDSFEEHSFLLRVPRDAEPRLSDEHVAARWVTPKEARAVLGWEAHREALDLALDAF
jgi:8-oxo-dGTP pyrophosphatase MutT (NUDIX family)